MIFSGFADFILLLLQTYTSPTYQSMGEAYEDDPRLSPMMVETELSDGRIEGKYKRRREARRNGTFQKNKAGYTATSRELKSLLAF